MRLDEALLRTKKLIEGGRYRLFSTRFSQTDYQAIPQGDTMVVGGKTYVPYMHRPSQQIIYGYRVIGSTGDVIHGLAFTKADYTFGEQDAFIWFDHDTWGFNYL